MRLANTAKNVEDYLRARWIHELPYVLLGELLVKNLSNLQLRGAGRQASTLRSRVLNVKRFLRRLTAAKEVPCPTQVSHLMEYLQMLSEPNNHGALKNAHQAFFFLEKLLVWQKERSSQTTHCA